MPKISLDNLERYHGHLKDWCDARFAEKKVHENWHEAGPSGAVSFYPVPNRPIDPVVNFAFTETLPEGTKGPDNPSMITGVSSITVTRCETVGVNSTDYTVALGDTYYGGSVDLSTGVMTVTHVAYDIGQSMTNYSSLNTVFYFDTPKAVEGTATCESFMYNQVALSSLADGEFRYSYEGAPTGTTRWLFRAIDYTTVEAFATAFAGYKLVYQLDILYTVQLTPTQIYSLSQPNSYIPRINTVYSDQQSVLVRYPKSPIVTGSELDNAILSLGGD